MNVRTLISKLIKLISILIFMGHIWFQKWSEKWSERSK